MQHTTISKLLKIHNNRKTWKRTPAFGSVAAPLSPVIYRLLSIRQLELNVKDAVEQAFEASVIPTALEDCYQTIIEDEINHSYQLQQLAIHAKATDAVCPERFVDGFNKLVAIENPLAINFVLECVVFINVLPLLQKYGDSFCNAVASWILLDEARHVAFGRTYVSAMEIELSESCMLWAFELLRWILEPLEAKEQERIVKNAWKCLNEGVFNDAALAVIPANTSFFENERVVY
jgi:hypothetical protein